MCVSCLWCAVVTAGYFEQGAPHRDISNVVAACMESAEATDESTIKVRVHVNVDAVLVVGVGVVVVVVVAVVCSLTVASPALLARLAGYRGEYWRADR